MTGNLIPKPASLSGSTTYNDNVWDESYRLKGSYGGDVGLEVVGNWLLKTDGGVKKYVASLFFCKTEFMYKSSGIIFSTNYCFFITGTWMTAL